MITSSILTAKCKIFLKQFNGKERTAESLQQLSTNLKPLLINNPEQKHVLHLQLFLHVKLQQIDTLRSTKCSGFDSLFAADPFLEFNEYIDLIYQLNLHSDFLHMVYSAKYLDFSKELLSIAVKPTNDNDERYKLDPNCIQLYLFTLTCMVSYDLEKFSETLLIVLDLLKRNGDMEKCEKLAILFQVVGLSNCNDNEDVLLSIGPEYNTLAIEWKYRYKTNEATSKSETLFNDLFNLNDSQLSKKDNKLDVLKLIDKYLLENDNDFVPKDNEVVDSSNNYSGFKSQKEYLGAHSHLTRLILMKKFKACDAENIFNVVTRFSKFKPKTTVKEYNYGNLKQFCQLMKDKGMQDFSRKEWFLRLIQFPNCFEERVGVKTAMEFLKQHPMDIDIELIRTLMKKLESFDTDEDIKRIALEAYIGLNSNAKKTWLQEFFADEFHSVYELENYEIDLKMMCSRAGSFENFSEGVGNGIDNDNSNEKDLITRIHSLCYQNIETTIEKFLIQVIKSKQFQLLHKCRMYCDLPSSPDTSDDTLLFSAFKSLLFTTEPNTPMMEHLIASIALFLEEELFEFLQIYKMVKEILDTNIKEDINYPKALSLLLIYEKVLEFGLKTFGSGSKERDDLIKQSIILCNRIECQSYIFAKGLNFIPLCKIRNKCIQLGRFMQEKEPALDQDKLVITDDFTEQMKTLDTFNYALLYVRSPAARLHIKNRLEEQDVKIDSSYAKILPKTLDWMVNLTSEEWIDGLEFLQLLFDTRDDFKSSFGTFPAFMREFILFSQHTVQDSGLFSHLLQIFELYMNNLMKTDEFTCDSNNQYEFASTLVLLTQHYCKREEYMIVQQILFNIFSLIDWMVEKNCKFYESTIMINGNDKDKDNDGLKEKLLDLLVLVPEFEKTSIPFTQAIVSKINTNDPNRCEEESKVCTFPIKKEKKKRNFKQVKP